MKIIIATMARVTNLFFLIKTNKSFTKISNINGIESCGTPFQRLYQKLHQ